MRKSKRSFEQFPFVRKVSSHIRKLLPRRLAKQTIIASLMKTSPKTLQRRLAEYGLTFSELVEHIRHVEAVRLLQNSGDTISEVAARVGYSDAPHFTRAFLRWTGTTPRRFSLDDSRRKRDKSRRKSRH